MDTQDKKISFSGSGLLFAAILGASVLLSVGISLYTYYRVRSLDDTVSTTGSAKQLVTSDTVKWTSQVSRTVKVSRLSSGYTDLSKDLDTVKKFLISKGIPENLLIVSTVSQEQNYDIRPELGQEKEYILRQTIEINSNDVQGITTLAKDSSVIINQGINFTTTSIEYFYTKLSDVRVALLSDAIKDARVRADKMVEGTGRKIGIMKSTSSGVVQVMPVNSVDVSDYGTYDTSHIDKEVTITVRSTFSLK